ncbi:hypothetical protein Tco_0425697 [Tanacetum coccineum]
MHIRNDPSFFLTHNTGVHRASALGSYKPLSVSLSVVDNYFISEGPIDKVAVPTGAAQVQFNFETLLVESEVDRQVFRKYLQEVLELLCRSSSHLLRLSSTSFAVNVQERWKTLFPCTSAF